MLEIKNVLMRFQGLVAVNDVNLKITDNSIYALIGPNGAGKTTLFNIITGVYKPTNGDIFFNDDKIDGLPPHEICNKGISRTFQNIRLFKSMTVMETVLVGMQSRLQSGFFDAIINSRKQRMEEKAAREKAEEILEFVGLADKRYTMACSLPYGGQRMLEIARGLVNDPKLILLDEPAAGMNNSEKVELTKKILCIRDRGVKVLLVEHNMKLVMEISDYIYVLNYGRLIAEGDPVSIQNNDEVITAYLGGK